MENKITHKLKNSLEKKEHLYDLSSMDAITYGINNRKIMKGEIGIRYNSPNSLIRLRELSNPKDSSLRHKTNQSPKNIKHIRYDYSQTTNDNLHESQNLPLLTNEKYKSNSNFINSKMKTFSGAINPLSSHEFKGTNIKNNEKNNFTIRDSNNNPWLKYEYFHPGKWTKMATDLDSKKSGDQRLDAWSCCVSTDKNSQVS